jgi:hypothetical protein
MEDTPIPLPTGAEGGITGGAWAFMGVIAAKMAAFTPALPFFAFFRAFRG